MKVIDLKEGQYCTRPNWGHHRSVGKLCIGLVNGKLQYFDKGKFSSNVRKYSTAYNYTNFKLCGIDAQPIKEGSTMKEDYKEVTVVVTTSEGQVEGFKTEDDALDWIGDTLEKSPRVKFTMFKPYQKIEPKRPSLADLIIKITG